MTFFAGAGEKAPAPGCYWLRGTYCEGKEASILITFSHVLTSKEKIGWYTFQKAKLPYLLKFSKLHCLLKLLSKILFYPELEPEPEPEPVKIGPAPKHWLGGIQLVEIKAVASFGFNCYFVHDFNC